LRPRNPLFMETLWPDVFLSMPRHWKDRILQQLARWWAKQRVRHL